MEKKHNTIVKRLGLGIKHQYKKKIVLWVNTGSDFLYFDFCSISLLSDWSAWSHGSDPVFPLVEMRYGHLDMKLTL